jgi:hypothetical protein
MTAKSLRHGAGTGLAAMNSHTYDAVIVLGGGIVHTEAGFVPTSYQDYDHFGMLGGAIRITAALELYRQHPNTPFVFTTGVTAKTTEQYGERVPTEAEVYSKLFVQEAQTAGLDAPTIILEDRSVNTLSNIRECLALIVASGWQHVAVISSDYHIARVTGLIAMLQKAAGVTLDITCLSAESILKEHAPGAHDARIDAAYQSEKAKERLANEAAGVAALSSGSYIPGEFQLSEKQ